MRSDVAVLILSYGRADCVKTYKTLRSCGYTGPIYIVVDDMDAQVERYRELYGDQVIVFSKKAVEPQIDLMTNRVEYRSVVYARYEAYNIAERLGYRYFLTSDDDIAAFTHRYIQDNELKRTNVRDFDRLLDDMVGFMESGNVALFGFGESWQYAGKKEEKFANNCERTCFGVFLCDVRNRVKIRGLIAEDWLMLADASTSGKVVLTTLHVCFRTPARTTNEGGNHDLYAQSNKYMNYFYQLIAYPNLISMRFNERNLTIQDGGNAFAPKILSSRYRRR